MPAWLQEGAWRHYYREPHRFYHTDAHIDQMFDVAREEGVALSEAQVLAIVGHDLVYVPMADFGDNERMSALLLRRLAGPGETTDAAALIIQDTARHIPTHSGSAAVIDLDLYRLAADWDGFLAYRTQLFQESGLASRQAFDEKTREFYRAFLQRPSIFITPLFRRKFEALARTNIQRALLEL